MPQFVLTEHNKPVNALERHMLSVAKNWCSRKELSFSDPTGYCVVINNPYSLFFILEHEVLLFSQDANRPRIKGQQAVLLSTIGDAFDFFASSTIVVKSLPANKLLFSIRSTITLN